MHPGEMVRALPKNCSCRARITARGKGKAERREQGFCDHSSWAAAQVEISIRETGLGIAQYLEGKNQNKGPWNSIKGCSSKKENDESLREARSAWDRFHRPLAHTAVLCLGDEG